MTGSTIAGLLERRLQESGQAPEARITVAELHRVLLPYGVCRNELGFATKAEYDLAVLALLSRGGRIEVVEGRLAEAVRRELGTPEPGLAFLRDFAASELRVRIPGGEAEEGGREVGGAGGEDSEGPASGSPPPDREADGGSDAAARATTLWLRELEAAGGDPAGPEREDETRPASGRPESGGPTVAASGREETAVPPAGPGVSEPPEGDAGAPESGERAAAEHGRPGAAAGGVAADRTAEGAGEQTVAEGCWRCRATLPERAGLVFCPYCGTDQRAARCEKCGELLEESWAFCPRCGTEAGERPGTS